jgi:hypothetical protein
MNDAASEPALIQEFALRTDAFRTQHPLGAVVNRPSVWPER